MSLRDVPGSRGTLGQLTGKLGPYDKYDPQKVHNSLTAGTLRGPGKLAIPPILFAKKDESEAIGVSRQPRDRRDSSC